MWDIRGLRRGVNQMARFVRRTAGHAPDLRQAVDDGLDAGDGGGQSGGGPAALTSVQRHSAASESVGKRDPQRFCRWGNIVVCLGYMHQAFGAAVFCGPEVFGQKRLAQPGFADALWQFQNAGETADSAGRAANLAILDLRDMAPAIRVAQGLAGNILQAPALAGSGVTDAIAELCRKVRQHYP